VTYTLGISAFFHDSAAAVVSDGEIVAACQEERFSRVKHDLSFPVSAISYCLEEARISASDLHSVVFYEKPLLSFERILDSFGRIGNRGHDAWFDVAPKWIGEKLHIGEIIKQSLSVTEEHLHFIPHHLSHAASAFFPSPFESAAILTVDGVGEWATATIGEGVDHHIDLLRELKFPDSLGLLYSAFTNFCGFRVNSGEYKLMGLAPYGRPIYVDVIRNHLAELRADGSLILNQRYFDYIGGSKMISEDFAQLFGGPARSPEAWITRREMDIAASIQAFTEEVILKMAAHAKKITGQKYMCLAGGVALNCVANGRLLRSGLFEDIWIQPAAGDAGCAIGAALAVQYGLLGLERTVHKVGDHQKGSYLGPGFSEAEVEAFLDSYEIPYVRLAENARALTVAKALADGAVVGFFNGRMEFGPRALGARSILGDPRRPDTQSRMNLRVKFRESFRPFAPSVLIEDVEDYFELDRESPYMMLVAPVRENLRTPRDNDEIRDDNLLDAVNQVRSTIPAVTHWDYSARVQTVDRETNPMFHAVLSAFKNMTGVSVLVNTSFNVRGEPIICTPEDAYRCLMRTDIDCLYLEGYWLTKADQPNRESVLGKEEEIFELD
jgi:carbamoyltransferase